MPTIRNGTIVEDEEKDYLTWGVDSATGFFWGFLNNVYFFFETLVYPQTANTIVEDRRRRDPYSRNSGGGRPNICGIRPQGEHNVPMGGG